MPPACLPPSLQRMAEAETERLRYLPQEVAREAAAARQRRSGAGECTQGWLLDTLDSADAAALGNGFSASMAEAEVADGCGGEGSDGQEEARTAAATCVPLLVGNPDSESLDADSVPCVPAETASRLTTPAAVKAFVHEFQRNKAAQREQLERGSITGPTADRMAREATATAAAAVAAGGSASGQAWLRGGSIDYGGCAIEWDTDLGEGRGTFVTGASSASSSTDAAEAAATPLPLSGHFIVCGAEESFAPFVSQLRKCGPSETPIVILHPTRPDVANSGGSGGSGVDGGGPIFFVEGSASDAASLRQAGASSARALVYLARAGAGVVCGWGCSVVSWRGGISFLCSCHVAACLQVTLLPPRVVAVPPRLLLQPTGRPQPTRNPVPTTKLPACPLPCPHCILQPGRCAALRAQEKERRRSAPPARRCWQMLRCVRVGTA